MRWNWFVTFLLFSFSASAQNQIDSIQQIPIDHGPLVGNIWNGILISAADNPALAGFDRRLQFSYSFQGERLKVPEGTNTKKPGFWNQSAEIDFAFGGARKNVGVNISYNGGRELVSDYHRVQIAHSYRINLNEHKLIVGAGLQYLKLSKGYGTAAFGDGIDPRFGWVYPTSELFKPDSINALEYSVGLVYNWKPIFIGYSFSSEHRSLLTPAEQDFYPLHHINGSFNHHFEKMGHVSVGLTVKYNSFDWHYEPYFVVTWKENLFVSISSPDVRQFKLHFGITRWGVRVFYACSFYFNKYAIDTYGVASMQGGLRYHFKPFKRNVSEKNSVNGS